MAKFVKVARAEDIAPGEKRIFEVDGTVVVVINLDGQFYASASMVAPWARASWKMRRSYVHATAPTSTCARVTP